MPHLLIGNFDRPAQPAQGWTFHQAVFCHSYLGGSTDGKHGLLLLTPPTILLHTSPYAYITKQPWNPILASVNPVTSAVPKIQPAQPDNSEARVYGSKSKVLPYGLFPALNMGKRMRLTCVYNFPLWVI